VTDAWILKSLRERKEKKYYENLISIEREASVFEVYSDFWQEIVLTHVHVTAHVLLASDHSPDAQAESD